MFTYVDYIMCVFSVFIDVLIFLLKLLKILIFILLNGDIIGYILKLY